MIEALIITTVVLVLIFLVGLFIVSLDDDTKWLSHANSMSIKYARVTIVRRIGDGKYLLRYSTGVSIRFIYSLHETDISLTRHANEAKTYDTEYHADIAKENTYKAMKYLVELEKAANKERKEQRKNNRYKKLR